LDSEQLSGQFRCAVPVGAALFLELLRRCAVFIGVFVYSGRDRLVVSSGRLRPCTSLLREEDLAMLQFQCHWESKINGTILRTPPILTEPASSEAFELLRKDMKAILKLRKRVDNFAYLVQHRVHVLGAHSDVFSYSVIRLCGRKAKGHRYFLDHATWTPHDDRTQSWDYLTGQPAPSWLDRTMLQRLRVRIGQ